MNRQNIILGNYTYLVDHYEADKDYTGIHKKYVVLRNTVITNGIAYDNAIYFIEYDIIEECMVDGKLNADLLSTKIVYPSVNNLLTTYHSKYNKFNTNFDEDTFDINGDIEKMYSNNYDEAYLLCDKFRLYYPVLNTSLNAIICIYSTINNVNVYFLCRDINQYKSKSDVEIEFNNNIYSEYIDIYIPNVEYLFDKNNIYIIENYNINEIKQEYKHISGDNTTNIVTKITPIINDNGELNNVLNINIISTNYNYKYKLIYDDYYEKYLYKKTTKIIITKADMNNGSYTLGFVKAEIISSNPDKSILFNVYEYLSEYAIYVTSVSGRDRDLILNKDTLPNYTIKKITKTDNITYYNFEFNIFDFEKYRDLTFCVDNKEFPINISSTKVDSTSRNIIELKSLVVPFSIERVQNSAYDIEYKKVYNNIYNDVYNIISNNINFALYPYESLNKQTSQYLISDTLSENVCLFNNDIKFSLKSNYSFTNSTVYINSEFVYPKYYRNMWESYSTINNVNLNDYIIFDDENTDEIDINIETDINTIGYRFEISNDKYFKHIIYSYDQPINLYVNDGSPIIDNFQFIVPRLFTSWDNIPELLVIRTIFIDKLTTTVMYSNPLVISHEMYKYLINDESINRISSLISRQTKIDTENMNLDNFNFIDKINCVVVKDNADKTNIGSINNTPKILYKPIFYKAYQLQNVKIKSSLIQNVGINLADLLTKVETFKLVINGIQHIEIGRNDVYVIFNVDANKLGGQSGSYIITNQDDEYISDGLWTIS